MKTNWKISMFAALLGATLVGACGADQATTTDEDTDVVDLGLDEGKDDSASSLAQAKRALPTGASHIYFGTASQASLNDDQPLAYRWFTANASSFRVDADTIGPDGATVPGVHVGFKLQRAVKRSGRWQWSVVAQGESDNGRATISYRASTGPGLYLITATGAPLPLDLNLHIDCGGTSCATAGQPGASCGGIRPRACDAGTFCAYSLEQQCGAGDQAGVCTIVPNICPRGIRYNPVCGCDGRTYDGGCGAAAASTSIQRTGPCEVDVVGGWSQIAADRTHYDYTFAADGSFTSVMQPGCLFGTPVCGIRIAQATGHYNIAGTTVFVYYDGAIRTGETASFTYGRRLTGTDYGASLTLTRTR